ncbi:MAG: CamS family sex pheromone protein [Mycoplasmatales bacterium]
MKRIIILLLMLSLLSGCNQSPPESLAESETTAIVEPSGNYKIESPLDESPIKGIARSTDSYLNFDDMESSLVDLSKEFVKTQDYFYKPGDILTTEEVNELLQRESSEYPNGLNLPEENNPKENPIYVNTMVESDFYTLNEKSEQNVNTIAFGFGIDTTYTYDEDKDDVDISDDEIENFITKYISNKMVNYIRQVKEIEDVNIICAFYKESNDMLLPGSYYTYGYIPVEDEGLEKVKTQNIEYKMFPDYSSEDTINLEIENFVTKLNQFFISNTGVSAIGKYEDNKLVNLDMEVVIQYYSEINLESLIQYIKDNLTTELLAIPKLEITIKSSSGDTYAILEYNSAKIVTEYIK